MLNHVDQDHLAKVTLVLPRCPDVDALVAAYFVQELLDKGCLPAEAWQLVEYVQRVQTGTLPPTPSVWHTPYGVMLGIRGRNLRYCREHALSQTQQDLYDVQRTFYFLRYLLEHLAAGVDIVSYLKRRAKPPCLMRLDRCNHRSSVSVTLSAAT